MLKLISASKIYDSSGVTALHRIDLHVARGDYVSVTGASGSGKSTLMHILGLLDTLSSGSYLLCGTDVSHLSPAALTARRASEIGFVFQQFQLLPGLTALENTALPLAIGGIPRSVRLARARAALLSVGLGDRMEHLPNALSGGQQQRVAIARALATNPKILLCDEATSALDPTTTRSILALLKEINRTLGITIIVITHEMAVIEEICQRVAIIDSSRIAEVGAVDDVFTRPQSAMAKQLIYPDGKRRALATGKRYCRIVFDGNSSFEPVVSNMVLECKAPVNIMFADTKNIDGKAYGQMILQLPEDERAAKRALAYLETQNVHTEEVDANAAV